MSNAFHAALQGGAQGEMACGLGRQDFFALACEKRSRDGGSAMRIFAHMCTAAYADLLIIGKKAMRRKEK